MTPTVSIIIPVFNAETTLLSTIESVVGQTRLPDEVVLVDDGSTDNSLNLCREIASQYEFIKVISQPNSGVTSARSLGVKNASGQWIAFLDSDDILPSSAIADLLGGIDGAKFDIVIGEIYNISTPRIIPNEEYRDKIIRGLISTAPYAKLFRRTLFSSNCIFDIPRNVRYGEDMLMNISLAFLTDKPVRNIGKKVYEYVRNSKSVSHSFTKTLEYEESYRLLVKSKIPPQERQRYIDACFFNRINGWRGINLLNLNVKPNTDSDFYRNLLADLATVKPNLTSEQRLHVYGTSLPARLLAVFLNLIPILRYRLNLFKNKIPLKLK